ncbi:hypothetical protein CEXT_689331 [Caerostris extrusa]|uniref:Uncharacterized protein n=1 Tax=Caerostris extrusa TaxID=172846 RepID=A0AAV4RQB7_CAEEX|nr:hypothetical protein CEXT_689331 [Caerostris extrusa]
MMLITICNPLRKLVSSCKCIQESTLARSIYQDPSRAPFHQTSLLSAAACRKCGGCLPRMDVCISCHKYDLLRLSALSRRICLKQLASDQVGCTLGSLLGLNLVFCSLLAEVRLGKDSAVARQ